MLSFSALRTSRYHYICIYIHGSLRFGGRFVSGGIRYVSACVWVVGLGFSGVRGNRVIHVRRALLVASTWPNLGTDIP